jgi:hypothetical protein
MRSALRSLTFGLAATLAGAALAQQPYTLTLNGVVTGCYDGQTVNVQTVQGTEPAWNLDVPVDPNTCTWTVTLGVTTNYAWYTLSTLCNGGVVNAGDMVIFNEPTDSVSVFYTLSCAGDADCAGIFGGPNVPGTLCFNDLCQVGVWSTACVCELDSINPIDCAGVHGGSALPGTACDDGNPATDNDLWNCACECVGEDTSYTDCAGEVNGPSLPGTACVDFFGNAGIWSAGCICEANSNPDDDCLGNPGGSALPGTECTYTPDNGNTWVTGIWSIDCICGPDTGGFIQDCLGEFGGSALPGTPCTVPGTTLEGTWTSDCICDPNNTAPCTADFWVVQAMGSDSLPVPYELWVWNLSSGGNGNFAFTWDFGDGSSSNEAFPTHAYDGNGPYNLCLTIADNNGCSDTHCDTISINGDGMYEGMIVHAEDRQEGFTINVQQPVASGVQEVVVSGSIATWPNPAVDELNVAVVSGMKGLVTLTITDLDGRTVKTERTSLGGGRSQLRIATGGLNAGLYMLRITDGSANLSHRFVKTN